MNSAIERRLQQLERWRQNEADVELKEQQLKSVRPNCNSSIQKIKFKKSASSGDITFLPREKSNSEENEAFEASEEILDTPGITSKSKKTTKKSDRPVTDLKVRFSYPTLFFTACELGDINECEHLLRNKLVDINVTNSEGLTGLHLAVIHTRIEMVEYLINQGADINCRDHEGWTPLHAAASTAKSEIVEILLNYGADATVVNSENNLACDVTGNAYVKDMIREHLKDVDIDDLHKQEECLIEQDIERWMNTGHYDGRSHPATKATVLHVLASKGPLRLIKRILETPILKNQIDLEAQDNEGYTPLLAASFWNQSKIVELLIEHGANIFAEAKDGYQLENVFLKNYQQNKLQRPLPQSRSVLQSNNADDAGAPDRRSTTSLDSSESEPYDAASLPSGSARHLKQGQLAKSHSLDIGKKDTDNNSQILKSSVSVDRLLSRVDFMPDRELRKSFKELVIENEQLKRQLSSLEDLEQKNQDWIRKERQWQRKVSELEEENKQLEQWKQEVQRLKEENRSLIRVVSKLSKH